MSSTDQTQAVYAAEDLWINKCPDARVRFGDWNEVWPFYWSLADRLEGDIKPPAVKPRKGALKAHYDASTRTVYLPPYAKGGVWALNTGVALHEFAHHLTPGAGHGPDYRAAMILCLEALGWTTAPLIQAYAEVGLGANTKADSITDKVGKLLTHADKAATDEERRTYLEKAEGMAATHSISLALLRKRQADKGEEHDRPTTGTLFRLDALPSVTYRNLAVELGSAICRAHGAQCTIRGKSSYMTFYGFPEDINLTELMLTRVTPMMFEEAEVYLKSYEHRHSGVASISARITFCKSFAWEVGARLSEAVTATEKEVLALYSTAEVASTELALREKAVEVRDYIAHEFKRQGVRGSWSGSSTGNHSADASSAGRQSARQANLFGRKELS